MSGRRFPLNLFIRDPCSGVTMYYIRPAGAQAEPESNFHDHHHMDTNVNYIMVGSNVLISLPIFLALPVHVTRIDFRHLAILIDAFRVNAVDPTLQQTKY